MFHSLRKIISRLDVSDWFAAVSAVLLVVGVVVGCVGGNNRHTRHTHPTPQNQNVSPGIVYESLQRYSDKSLPKGVCEVVMIDSSKLDSVLIELRELNNRLRMLDSINRTLRDGYRRMCLVNRSPQVSTGVEKIKSVVVGEVFDLEVFKE